MNPLDDLRACPFCGAKAGVTESAKKIGWFAYCPKCGASGGLRVARGNAIKAWNRRSQGVNP